MSDDLFANCRDEKAKPIVTALIEDILAAGHSISVNDDFQGDGEWVVKHSKDKNKIFDALCSTDGDLLKIRNHNAITLGFVSLIWGNGRDVIHDVTLEDTAPELMARAEAIVERMMTEDFEALKAQGKI